jgi:glycine/D-amino acid oxidase-like deaminating enzyme
MARRLPEKRADARRVWDKSAAGSHEVRGRTPLQDMLARCAGFLPAVADLRLDRADPLRVGLRPYRAGNVRLETEPGTRIVHNYGHGGAAVTLSWAAPTMLPIWPNAS